MNWWELQVAVMARLAPLPIFDTVPDKTPKPYSTLGPSDAIPLRSFGRPGARTFLVIHHWGVEQLEDRVFGNKQILEQARVTKDLLDGKPLVLADGTNIGLRWQQTIIVPDPNPNVRHATSRFRVDVRT